MVHSDHSGKSLRFLITGARAPVALEWVRRLGRAGYTVAAADSFIHPACLRSRYLSRYFKVPPPRQQPEAFAESIHHAAVDFSADFILPTCEEIFYLARFRELFDGVCQLFAEPLDILDQLHNKRKFAALTHHLGHAIQAPESHELHSQTDLISACQLASSSPSDVLEWVLKPVYSRFAAQTLVRPTHHQCQSIHPSPKTPWLAQRFVAGTEYCSYSLAVKGKVVAHGAYQPKHRSGSGAGYYFDPVDCPDFLDFTRRIVGGLAFTGQIAFDFITGNDGRTWVLECNPRATSGLHLLKDVDPAPYLIGTNTELWSMDYKPKMLGPVMLLEPGRWARRKDFRKARDVIHAKDDRRPLFSSLFTVLELKRRARKLGVSIQEACTADIEWNGTMEN